MSNFAKFSCATDLTKTIDDLLKEINEIREEKRACEFVEITGPGHRPIYARGHIHEDKDDDLTDGSSWEVKLKQVERCSPQDIGSIEVWLRNCCMGGPSLGTATAHPMPGEPFDSSGVALVVVNRSLAVKVKFGFTQEEAAASALFRDNDVTAMPSPDFWRILSEDVPRAFPAGACVFYTTGLRRERFLGLDEGQGVVEN